MTSLGPSLGEAAEAGLARTLGDKPYFVTEPSVLRKVAVLVVAARRSSEEIERQEKIRAEPGGET